MSIEKPPDEDQGEPKDQDESKDTEDKADQPSGAGPIPPEVLDKLPKEQRATIEATFASLVAPIPNPIAAKITPEHITQVITAQDDESKRDFDDRRHGRLVLAWFAGAVLIIVVATVLLLAVMNRTVELDTVLKLGTGLVGGFGAGYGVASRRRRSL